MKTTTRNTFIVLGLIVLLAVIALCSMDTYSVVIDGEPVYGASGVGVALVGGVIGLLAAFFAVSLVGVILAGVSIGLAMLVAVILGAVALALAPLLLPLLLLLGIVALVSRRKHA